MPFDNANYEPEDSVLQNLRALRAYHGDPAKWCNTGFASENGYCIAGAVGRIALSTRTNELEYLRRALPSHVPFGDIIAFNERMGTTHAELMAFYDRAIEIRRAELLVAS